MNGSVIPIIGSRPIVIDILYICWNNKTDIMPPIEYLSVKFFVLFTEFIRISPKKSIEIKEEEK